MMFQKKLLDEMADIVQGIWGHLWEVAFWGRMATAAVPISFAGLKGRKIGLGNSNPVEVQDASEGSPLLAWKGEHVRVKKHSSSAELNKLPHADLSLRFSERLELSGDSLLSRSLASPTFTSTPAA
nr:4-hydroxy-3-methylbut-2-en-1-yl diphosphate synthase (ferredoxin), chloroplastic [Ipomoea batatas]